MFKKFKDKIAEEMKQSPARLQASMQQFAQAVVSPALSNSSIPELSTSNDNFSLTEEGDETPKNSPVKHGFQNVNLVTPPSNTMGISRGSSVSSVTSDTSSLFPIYESPSNLYHLQSDVDQSASEVDENIGPQLDRVTKDQLYSAYKKVSAKYHKYRGRYTDLVAHYRELERAKTKLESVLVETQDKVLRRVSDLKEQCQLEQQAKAHLEEVLRTDIEEKDHIINTLNTKVKFLQENGPSLENLTPEQSESKENAKVDLIDLTNDSSNSTNENSTLAEENAQLKEKLKKLEGIIFKYKDFIKTSKAKFAGKVEPLREELASAKEEIASLTDQVSALKKREEECVISLAENKLSIHRELEDKEEQIKQLQLDLKQMTEAKENFRETVEKYRLELEKLGADYEADVDADSKARTNLHDEKSDSKNKDAEKDSDSFAEDVEDVQARLQELQAELSTLKNENKELRNESEADKIVADERRRETDSTIQNLQATIHSLDREAQNMRDALTDRDRVCETYKSKMQEYIGMLEKSKEQLSAQEAEMKDLRGQMEESERAKLKELDSNSAELSRVQSELESYKRRCNALNSLVAIRESIARMKDDWHNLRDVTRERILGESNFMQIVGNSIVEGLRNKLESYEKRFGDQANLETELLNARKLLQETTQKAERFDELSLTNGKMAAEIDNLKRKICDLESALAEAERVREENRNLTEKMKELDELKAEHAQTLKSVESLASANEENVKFAREIESLKSKVADSANVISCKEEEIKVLAEKLLNEEANVAKIAELEERIAILKDIEQKHEEVTKETLVLKQQLADFDLVTGELAELRSKYEESLKLSSDQSAIVESYRKNLQSEIFELKDQLNEKEWDEGVANDKAHELQKVVNVNDMQLMNLDKELQRRLERPKNQQKVENTDAALARKEGRIHAFKCKTSRNSGCTNCEFMTMKHKKLQATLYNVNRRLKKSLAVKNKQDGSIHNFRLQLVDLKSRNVTLMKEMNALKEEAEPLRSTDSETQTLEEASLPEVSQSERLSTTGNDEASVEDAESQDIQQTSSSRIQAAENEELMELRNKLDLRVKEYEALVEQYAELNSTVEHLRVVEDQNKTLIERIACFKGTEDENAKLKAELTNANEMVARSEEAKEKVKIEKDRLETEKDRLETEKDRLETEKDRLETEKDRLETEKNKDLESLKRANAELQSRTDELRSTISTMESREAEKVIKLRAEVDELKAMIDEKQAELKLLDTRNTELLREIEKMNSLSAEAINESVRKSEDLEKAVALLERKNANLQSELDELSRAEKKSEHENNSEEEKVTLISKLQKENKKLEAQLDEALITFQSKESQMQAANNESKMYAEKLKEKLRTHEEEQNMRLKQLVKEFQAQLHDKEEELQAALEKRFDRQKNYESDLIQQYKEQLKDFQVELTAKSEQIESLIIENKDLSTDKTKEISQLTDTINQIKKEHANEMKDVERKWKTILQQRTDKLENKHEEEINELTREWRNERRPDTTDPSLEELESTSRVAMAAVQSNTGSFHTLQQTLASQKRELTELRKLVKLRQDKLEDSTEIEYLRNILFEYMMGKETMVLARVISAVVKFDQQQTAKILKKEEDKLTLLGSLGLT